MKLSTLIQDPENDRRLREVMTTRQPTTVEVDGKIYRVVEVHRRPGK